MFGNAASALGRLRTLSYRAGIVKACSNIIFRSPCPCPFSPSTQNAGLEAKSTAPCPYYSNACLCRRVGKAAATMLKTTYSESHSVLVSVEKDQKVEKYPNIFEKKKYGGGVYCLQPLCCRCGGMGVAVAAAILLRA